MRPEKLRPGDPYRVQVRLVNRSNRTLELGALELRWSFDGMYTGGEVGVRVPSVGARGSAVVYQIDGEWTAAHQRGNASVTANLTLADGAVLANTLSW